MEPQAEAATSEGQLRSMAQPGVPPSPALWMLVALAALGSLSVLILWLVIYRQQRSSASASEDSKPEQQPLQKAEVLPVIHSLPSARSSHADDPSLCPFHLHLEAQSSLQCMEDTSPYRAATKHAGTEKSRGPPPCTAMREHRVPLPATELGGTALVTTKTV
ncbi:unnamed protein product [Tetraodon nigroviridis]|uniref:(spotted green pufferfish) hypothetical protein n=1 Tax=Tetraodon nigroviridis TaxID=99883 RepID=Q4T9J6_TETNG|nr:unnamed protein product [Tetraodon nigroviridis]